MKTLRILVATLITLTFSARAATYLMLWVGPTGSIIAPFALYGGRPLFVDSTTKYVWAINVSSVSSTTPVLATMGGPSQTFYTTTDCSGQAYLAVLPSSDFLNFTYTAYRDGLVYVPAVLSNVNDQIQSTWYNGCQAQAPIPLTYNMYTTAGPITAPALPNGPWHLETR